MLRYKQRTRRMIAFENTYANGVMPRERMDLASPPPKTRGRKRLACFFTESQILVFSLKWWLEKVSADVTKELTQSTKELEGKRTHGSWYWSVT